MPSIAEPIELARMLELAKAVALLVSLTLPIRLVPRLLVDAVANVVPAVTPAVMMSFVSAEATKEEMFPTAFTVESEMFPATVKFPNPAPKTSDELLERPPVILTDATVPAKFISEVAAFPAICNDLPAAAEIFELVSEPECNVNAAEETVMLELFIAPQLIEP